MDEPRRPHIRQGSGFRAMPLMIFLGALTGMAAVTVSVQYFASARSGESTAMQGAAPFVHDAQSVARIAKRLQLFGPIPEAPRIRHRHLRPTTEAHDTTPMPRGHRDRG